VSFPLCVGLQLCARVLTLLYCTALHHYAAYTLLHLHAQTILTRYDQNRDYTEGRERDLQGPDQRGAATKAAHTRRIKLLQEDEDEAYFNASDDDEEDSPQSASTGSSGAGFGSSSSSRGSAANGSSSSSSSGSSSGSGSGSNSAAVEDDDDDGPMPLAMLVPYDVSAAAILLQVLTFSCCCLSLLISEGTLRRNIISIAVMLLKAL
jgi:hypothetical protein